MSVAVIAIYDLSRHLWSSYWLRVVRPLDHDLKITAVLFAMMSAAAGNLFPQLLPWAAIIPNLTGIVLMVALVILHLRNHEKNGVQYRS